MRIPDSLCRLLRLSLAAVWIGSAAVGWLALGTTAALLAAGTPISPTSTYVLLGAGYMLDLAIGLLLLARWRPRTLAGLQVGLVVLYTAALTAIQPALWLDPFGALLKNLVLVPAALVLAALEQER